MYIAESPCPSPLAFPPGLRPRCSLVSRKSFMPVYRGQPLARCSFCTAAFDPKFKGQVCPVCEVCLSLARACTRALSRSSLCVFGCVMDESVTDKLFAYIFTYHAYTGLDIIHGNLTTPNVVCIVWCASCATQIGEIGFKGMGLVNSRQQRGKAAAAQEDFDMDD